MNLNWLLCPWRSSRTANLTVKNMVKVKENSFWIQIQISLIWLARSDAKLTFPRSDVWNFARKNSKSIILHDQKEYFFVCQLQVNHANMSRVHLIFRGYGFEHLILRGYRFEHLIFRGYRFERLIFRGYRFEFCNSTCYWSWICQELKWF